MNKFIFPFLTIFSISTISYGQFSSGDFNQSAVPFEVFNDGSANFNPIVGDNGTFLWFTRTGHEENTGGVLDQDIWFSHFDDGAWSKPSNKYQGLNSSKNDLIIGQSENKTFYLLRYNKTKISDLTTIEAYKKIGETYIHDHFLNLPEINISGSYFGFYVARDESFVIISMNAENSFGKEDLYISLKTDEGWSTPKNMGARINTSGFEMSPFVSKDSRHLFFSSEGHRSKGKGDIFMSERLDETWQSWSRPINLGEHVNSEGFEAYFSLNEKLNEAYFFSDSESAKGRLYSISYRLDPMVLRLNAHRSATGFVKLNALPAMSVKLNLLDENDQIVQSVTTTEDGYFNLQSFLPDRNYKIALDEEDRSELGNAEIFLANDLGEQMIFMNEEKLGIFGFKVLSGKKIDEYDTYEKLAREGKVVDRETTISGKVTSHGTLTEKLKLNIVDQNNEVLKTIETDEKGYFSFNTDAREKSYFLSLDKDASGLVDVYEVYLTNENPEEDIVVTKTGKYLFEFTSLINGGNSPIRLLEEKDISMPEHLFKEHALSELGNNQLSGYLTRDKLPLMNAEISLINDDDEVMGSTITDENGQFSIDTELLEGDYSLRLSDEEQNHLKGSEIFLAKNPNDVLFYLNDDRAGVFAFRKLARNKPITLYSLRTQAESGAVVSDSPTSLKGKFQYKKLPKTVVKLTLHDAEENVIQKTIVEKDGSFEFKDYIPEKTYFISAASEGLSDIYEIYISGQQKNVLVNRTDKTVFSFKMLPTEDVVISEAHVRETELRSEQYRPARERSRGANEELRDVYDFDVKNIESKNFGSLSSAVNQAVLGNKVVIRVFEEVNPKSEEIKLATLSQKVIQPLIDYLIQQGISEGNIEISKSTSDQALIILNN